MSLKIKRIISGIITLSITASLFAGCMDKTDDKSGSTVSGEAGTEKTILTILGPDATMNNDLKFEEREEYPVWQEFNKLFEDENIGFEFELVASDQYKTVIQTRMAAANKLPDIANISNLDDTTAIKLGNQGIILDVADLTEEYSDGTIRSAIDKYYPFADGLTTTPTGQKYWFSNLHVKNYQGDKPAPVGLAPLVRKDWMDALGAKAPTTAEEYYELLKTFQTKDANGNGVIGDEVLIADPSTFSNGIAQWFGLGYAVSSVRGDTLEVVSPWYQDGIKEYIKFMKKLADEKILDTSGISNVTEIGNQRKQENKLASIYDYGMESWLATQTGVEGAEYIPLPPLQAVEGVKPAAVVEPHTLVWNKYAITKDCKNLQAAITYFDIIHSDKSIELQTWGIIDEYYEIKDGVNYYKDRKDTKTEATTRNSRGNPLWGGSAAFPVIQVANLEYEIVPPVPQYKVDYQLGIMEHTPWYSTSNGSFMSIPSSEQTTEKNKIITSIDTYSKELLTKLILGSESLDDWDKFMAQFEELGLKKLIEIDQALVDTYKASL